MSQQPATIALVVALAVWLTSIAPCYAVDLLSAQTCASATCHGGAMGRGPAWNSSYTLLRSQDPHATAGNRLLDADSQRIVALLVPGVVDNTKSDEERQKLYTQVLRQRCVSCHTSASSQDVLLTASLPNELISDGVSCRSCHGPADRWLSEHTKQSWNGPQRFEPVTGMRDTESIVGRAETCVRCHVGSRSSDGLVRDMNHDLIAAGHPALRFDLWIYNQNMPHHWADSSESEKHFEESVMRVREIGRRVAAAAAADLSAERAQDSLLVSGATGGVVSEAPVPWPELGDFNCFACHQSIKPAMYQKWLSTDDELSQITASSGLPLWNAWFTAQRQSQIGSEELRALAPQPGNQKAWMDSMNRLAAGYRDSLKSLETQPSDPRDRLVAIGKSFSTAKKPRDWHDAAAVFLDLDAAARDLEQNQSTAEIGRELRTKLRDQVAPTLRFAAGDTPQTERRRSPFRFDANAFLSAATTALEHLMDEKP